ncbi:MAG: hypothetical protein PHR35_16855 [Kiritimatiellae bacterium]|nr:hypothetical protein [Kiritimatiellia bacterium]
MKTIVISVIATLCLAAARAGEPAPAQAGARPRIGVYDSRAIAVAFMGSPSYQASDGKRMTEMMAEHAKAKAAGDTNRVAELEAWGKAQQVRLHQQGFSTAPVDDVLKHIENQMPAIATAADVSAIVSKWDKAALARHPSAELVDVTMELVKAFHPTDRQLKAAIGIQKHTPISLERAERIDD